MFNNFIEKVCGIIAILIGSVMPLVAQVDSKGSAQSMDVKQISPNQPVRPKDFKPFVYTSTKSVREKHSQKIMTMADQEMAKVKQVNLIDGNYKPTWESLDEHTAPEWYLDAKFGMFVDWGLYSIPAYAPTGYPDWYLWRMHTDTKEYHNKYWGEDFKEDDFIPLFTASDFNARQLAEVAKDAGMKYVVPFLKHHDGFCLWNSSYTLRNSVEMGPHRDLAKEWTDALKANNLKFGFYYSIDDWVYPIIGRDRQIAVRQWHSFDGSYFKVSPFDENTWNRVQISGKIPVRDFYNQYINPAAVEFIDKYDPDLIWMDGDWIFGADERNTRELVAYYYNQAKGRKSVAINDAYGCTRLHGTLLEGPDDQVHGDFLRSEGGYSAKNKGQNAGKNNPPNPGEGEFDGNLADHYRPWEECSGLSHSFGYKWEETDKDVRSAKELLDMLIDIVSEGGNLLLITNLTSTGKLDPLMAERLKEVGAWLNVNGEAIYATREWTHSFEKDVCFTRSKDGRYVYAICKKWPGSTFASDVLKPKAGSIVTMLGTDNQLKWTLDKDRLSVKIPEKLQDDTKRPCQNAWVFKIEVAQ